MDLHEEAKWRKKQNLEITPSLPKDTDYLWGTDNEMFSIYDWQIISTYI